MSKLIINCKYLECIEISGNYESHNRIEYAMKGIAKGLQFLHETKD